MIETNILQAMLNDTTLSTLTSGQMYFPEVPSNITGSYISFFRVSGKSDFYEIVNDDMYQFDIYADKDDYGNAIAIKNRLKRFFLDAYIEGAVLEYMEDTNDFQDDEQKYRIIMTYAVQNNS